jgi:3-oxoadipate enol-lactonase
VSEIRSGSARARDGCRLHYRLDGNPAAPALLFSNSLGTTLHMWDDQVPGLEERFLVVRYDTRGHGASDVPAGPYTIDELGQDALAVLDALDIERADFCGLSLGGMMGQWLGANAPERIRRLIVANTAALMGPRAVWDTRIAAVAEHGMLAVVETVLERWFTPGFRAASEPAVARVRMMLESTDPAGYAGCCAAIRDMDLRPSLAGIRAPSLVILGERDPSTPPPVVEAVAAAIPGARLARLDCAHLSNIECAAEFNELVEGFLSAAVAT